MPLQPGTTLGPYSVTAKIGEGGMGEVYRARDTKLDRDVALKVLPEAFTSDPDRLARFEREAKVLASLNHPNIGGIHGLEESDGVRALVLEYIEGPTLADRIAQGPIPVDDALPIAKQIAEALEAAHEAGVIHRDLKPANVVVKDDGTVKVLDFGLAKALEPEMPIGDASQSPTLTAAATRMGIIMGTAAYMSPEQAKGKAVDRRADVWAFGVVLFEMLSGKRAFVGDDVSDTMAAVLRAEADFDALPDTVPSRLFQVLRACLQKDPKRRVHDVADVRLAMEGAFETISAAPAETTAPQPAWFMRAQPWVAGLVLATITGLAVWMQMHPPAPLPTRFTIAPPPGVEATRVELSPDGRTVAFGGLREGTSEVYLRELGQLEVVSLRGTEGTAPLAFSPDGQELLVADATTTGPMSRTGSLRRVPLTGGRARALGEEGPLGAAWRPDDTLVLGSVGRGLRLVRASGGEATSLTELGNEEMAHLSPRFLPNGRVVLFNTLSEQGTSQVVAAYDIETGQRTDLLPGTSPQFATSGHLVFWREGALWAVPFDPDRLELRGDPVVVVEGIPGRWNINVAAYALSENGTLIYLPAEGTTTSRLGWVNREGDMTTPLVDAPVLTSPRLSPDGTRVVFQIRSETGDQDLWINDLESGLDRKLTETGAVNQYPIWTPNGEAVTFDGQDGDIRELFFRPADLSRGVTMLHVTEGISIPGSWTPDGQTLVYYAVDSQGDRDIWMLPADGDPVTFLATEFNERAPRLSPNGRWLAYISDQAGEDRVYVQAFPEGGPIHTISAGTSTEPVWSRDGRELFFRNGDQMWVVEVETGSEFNVGSSRLLFQGPYAHDDSGYGNPNYDVSEDGQHFLMVQSGEATETPGYRVVENWFEELKRLVPID